ncbi:MAG: BatA domain-containing protein [Luteolibacter sp.]
MSFLNSLPLWSALAALGVATPILIHLWSRNQKYEIPWAAMELLKKAAIARSQKIRIEDYLIMVLRCLALLLVATALLRPVFHASGKATGAGDTGVVIGIDASYSMNHGEPARFEKAVAKAREILATVGEGTPVSILLMSKHPQLLFRRTGHEPAAFAAGLTETARVSPHPLGLERNLEILAELAAELKTPTRECYLITDGQASDWQRLSDHGRAGLQKLGSQARVVVVPVDSQGNDNLALTALEYSAGSLQQNGSARFLAKVSNAGAGPVEGAMVEFFADGQLKSRQDVGRLETGENREVSFFTAFDNAGEVALSARLSPDALADDNERHLIAGVRASVRVLCLDGGISDVGGSEPRGAYYAIRALRLKNPDDRAPIKVTHLDAADATGANLGEYDVVVMIDVPEITAELGERLREFTTAGGGLMVFLGDKVVPDSYNAQLVEGDDPLLPARLDLAVGHEDPTKGWQIVTPVGEHPIARLVGGLPPALTAEARFRKAIRVIPGEGAETILELDGGRLPLWVASRERPVLLCSSSADRSWNNLPLHPLFMILMQQSVTMLSSPEELGQGIVGELVTVPLPGRMMGEEVEWTDPLGTSVPVRVTVSGGATVGTFSPSVPGVHRIGATPDRAGAMLAANVDTAESDVRGADAGALRKWLEDLPVDIVSEGLAEAAINRRSGRDLGLGLLGAGIIAFIVQGLLANHLSLKKHADSGDLASSLRRRRVAAARRS